MAVFLYNNDIFTSRMPKERLEKALKQREMISDEDYAKVSRISCVPCAASSSRRPMSTV